MLFRSVRAVSTEGWGRVKYYQEIRSRLDNDPQFLPYFEHRSSEIPQFYVDQVRKDLGPLWDWLPEGGLEHDPNAYLKAEQSRATVARVKMKMNAPAGARLETVRIEGAANVGA